ncbi:MAG: adenylosuccinate lyase family protein [Oceanospirillaceae bacterium]|nr:adenylosuccinate lyase family protein [Oceanospirillaceae bacterium]
MNREISVTQADIAAESFFSDQSKWQSWLDVEAALALSQGEIGMIPEKAATKIAAQANLASLDISELRKQISQTMAPVFALSECLATVCAENGAYVHWGATTQNIVDTGRLIVLNRVQNKLFKNLNNVLHLLSVLAKEHANTVMVGRTNRQNALPITFGFKVAGWIDELMRVADQLNEIEPRLFQLRFGGAVGAFHSLGTQGAQISELMAKKLGLHSSLVPNRTSIDPLIEYVIKLSMIGVACSRISDEFFLLMSEEIAEVSEAFADNVIGSSTMPHKVNPKYVVDLSAMAMQLRTKGGAALTVPSPSHEGDAVTNRLLTNLIEETCPLAINTLQKLHDTIAIIKPNTTKMRENFERSREMMATESLMMTLATTLGRGHAHDLVHSLVAKAKQQDIPLQKILNENAVVIETLGSKAIEKILYLDDNIGECAVIANHLAKLGSVSLKRHLKSASHTQ